MRRYILTAYQLSSLLYDSQLLDQLEAGGVDNWYGYDEVDHPSNNDIEEAMSIYKEYK